MTALETKERPILFSAPMVRALLDGSKTQTRRIVKHQPPKDWSVGGYGELNGYDKEGELSPDIVIGWGAFNEDGDYGIKCPYGQPGDRLWVREKYWVVERLRAGDHSPYLIYDEEWDRGLPNESAPLRPCGLKFGPHPSIHMPRWASRITLEITDIRVERLNDISEADADAEGFGGDFPQVVMPEIFDPNKDWGHLTLPQCYARLWESINGLGSWATNPWVWAVSFKVVEQ